MREGVKEEDWIEKIRHRKGREETDKEKMDGIMSSTRSSSSNSTVVVVAMVIISPGIQFHVSL
jgi:hypothetical protein